jgi:hypothetical protein
VTSAKSSYRLDETNYATVSLWNVSAALLTVNSHLLLNSVNLTRIRDR